MPLLFLVPAFLAGLALLVIPILIHLRRKQRSQVVVFPSLMFLEKIPYQSEDRREIQNWMLLLLRALAVILLVAAFARPFMDRTELQAGTLTGPKESVLLIDRSYSMAVGDRWSRALDAARAVVSSMGPLDRTSVVFFSSSAAAAQMSTSDRTRLRAAIDSARVSSQATRYGPGLRLAQSLLEASELPSRELVIISDFQRAGWTGEEGVHLPEGTQVNTITVADGPIDNTSLAGVTLTRQRFSDRERISPVARVTRLGGESPVNVEAILEIDGRETQRRQVSLPAAGAAQVTFEPFVLTARHMRGTVRVGTDALAQDNVHHFVVSPGAATGVLLVGDRPAPGGAVTRSVMFLQNALGITDEGGFDVVVRPGSPTDAELANRSVVILHDAPVPGGARLRRFVEGGGGLIVAVGERGTWPADLASLFPGTLGPVTDREQRGARLGEIDYSHPIFEIFAGPRSGDFTSARFLRARLMEVPEADSVRVLARFDDGSVALAERRVGAGRVLVWTSTLDRFWNDLVLQPVFLPFIHQMVRYASGRSEVVPSFLAGQVIDVTDSRAMATAGLGDVADELQDGERVVLSPDGDGLALRTGEGPVYLELDDQGFYEIRPPGRQDVRPLAVAVNVDITEADLSPLDPEEMKASITSAPATASAPRLGDAADEGLRRVEQERRQGIWRWLLLSAFLVLVVETAVSNRLSQGTAKRGLHAYSSQ
jgi:hypothetical protein